MEIKIRTEEREEQHYAAIRKQVTFQEIPKELPKLIPEVKNWLADRNIEITGPLFFNYLAMKSSGFDVEVGFPVKNKFEGDERVKPGKFEAGNYAVATYIGSYQNLHQVHENLQKWAKQNGIQISGPGTEFYITDPAIEPDQNKWQTDIVVKIPADEINKIQPQFIAANNP